VFYSCITLSSGSILFDSAEMGINREETALSVTCFLRLHYWNITDSQHAFRKKPQKIYVFIGFALRYAEPREGTNSLMKPLAMATVSFTIRP